MIALTISSVWLALTAAGFAGLSALRRAESRRDYRTRLLTAEHMGVLAGPAPGPGSAPGEVRGLIVESLPA